MALWFSFASIRHFTAFCPVPPPVLLLVLVLNSKFEIRTQWVLVFCWTGSTRARLFVRRRRKISVLTYYMVRNSNVVGLVFCMLWSESVHSTSLLQVSVTFFKCASFVKYIHIRFCFYSYMYCKFILLLDFDSYK